MNLNDEAIRAATAKAIIDTLTTEKRDELMQHAVASLFKPDQSRSAYGSKSPFQQAFEEAIGRVATDVARQELEKPENMAKIEELIAGGVKQALGFDSKDQWDSIQGKIADAIVKGLSGRDRY